MSEAELPSTSPEIISAKPSKGPATGPKKGVGYWLSWVVSVLFHPLLMPTYLFVAGSIGVKGFIYYTGDAWFQLLQLFMLLTVALPAVAIMILNRFKLVSGLTLSEQTDRPLPLFITALFYFLAVYLMRAQFMFNLDMLYMLIAIGVVIMLATVISLFWKISAHAIGTSGTLGLLVLLAIGYPENELLEYVVGASAAWGMTSAARLRLQAHTPAQVWVGSIIGLVVTSVVFRLLQGM